MASANVEMLADYAMARGWRVWHKEPTRIIVYRDPEWNCSVYAAFSGKALKTGRVSSAGKKLDLHELLEVIDRNPGWEYWPTTED